MQEPALTPFVNQNVDVALEYFTKRVPDKINDFWVSTLLPELSTKGITKQLTQQIVSEGIPISMRG
jgi:hypothetical protein